MILLPSCEAMFVAPTFRFNTKTESFLDSEHINPQTHFNNVESNVSCFSFRYITLEETANLLLNKPQKPFSLLSLCERLFSVVTQMT